MSPARHYHFNFLPIVAQTFLSAMFEAIRGSLPTKIVRSSQTRIYALLLPLFCIISSYSSLAQPTLQEQAPTRRTVYVKFREDSELYNVWRMQGRTGSIDALSGQLGKHTTKPLCEDNLLNTARERLVEQFNRIRSEENPYPIIENLSRWCEVICEEPSPNSSPLLAQNVTRQQVIVQKLRKMAGVEWVELQPVRKADAVPNDPLVGSQAHLQRIRAFEAWDVVAAQLPATDTSRIIIGVVDSGIDYEHEDLKDAMFVNPGESGIDASGNNRRSNGIDDDRNGKIDDWRGWDFVGASGNSEDNDPRQIVNNHGTHVAGILGATVNNRIGVAGAVGLSSRFRILPVKCSSDNASRFISNGERGILYAASMGAAVINCSFGSELDRSLAEEEIIRAVQKMGTLVVSTAGNNGVYEANYPAAYPDVLSVAWLTSDDVRAFSGSYHPTAGIGAPGSSIYSIYPENRYGTLGGSSMSAPQVTAAAALVKLRFPAMTAAQIAQHLKASADSNDALNAGFAGLLGAGRLNMLRAVQSETLPSLGLRSYAVSDENNNGIMESGERVVITLTLSAGRGAVEGAIAEMQASIPDTSRYLPFWDELRKPLPRFSAGEIRPGAVSFSFRLTPQLLQDFELPLTFTFRTANGSIIGRDGIVLVANQSYLTMRGNNVVTTVTTTGRLGYNDYPTQLQGDGMLYKPQPHEDLLYDSGLMISSGEDSLSSSARSGADARDRSFMTTSLIRLTVPPDSSYFLAKSTFADRNGKNDAGVSVEQQVFQYRNARQQNMLLQSFKITNTTPDRDFSRLFVGMFFDWDIGNPDYNTTYWDDTLKAGIVINTRTQGLPVVGIQLLSAQPKNFMPIVYYDTTQGALTLESFPRSDKQKSLASGIVTGAKAGDICNVLSAGPIALARNTSTTVTFAITLASSLGELQSLLRGDTSTVKTLRVFPNPAQNLVFLRYILPADQAVTIDIVNTLGQVVFRHADNAARMQGSNQETVNMDGLPSGIYFVRLRGVSFAETAPMQLLR